MTRLAMLALVFLAIVLGGVIAMESNPETLRDPLAAPTDIVRLGAATRHAGGSGQVQNWVDIILARPLFEPSRRPPPTAAGSGTTGPGFPRLTGIVILPQQREAIFAAPGKTQPIVVTAGSRLNGVLIKSIESGSVVVVDGAGTRIIRPSFATGGASAPSPSASVMVDLPPVPVSSPHASPFASIRGLSGRPLGLAAQPDTTTPSLPALAPSGGSP
jgi:hypothetical protein